MRRAYEFVCVQHAGSVNNRASIGRVLDALVVDADVSDVQGKLG